nr:FlaG family protein [Helicobacter suis]
MPVSSEIGNVSAVLTTHLDTHHSDQVVHADQASLSKQVKPEIKQEVSPPKEQDLQKLSKELNEEMRRIRSDLTFSYNEEIRSLVVTIKDSNGGKIIRQIPSQEVIKLAEKMHDIVGIIFDKKG